MCRSIRGEKRVDFLLAPSATTLDPVLLSKGKERCLLLLLASLNGK